jgi:hypothetical protein
MKISYPTLIASIVTKVISDLYYIFMKILPYILLIYAGIFIAAQNKCHAKTIYYGTETEVVNIVYSGETILRFNEPVRTISRASDFEIGPADKTNPDYSILSVTPRFTKGVSQVTFLLANGSIVSTKIQTVPKAIPEKTDSFYDFIAKSSLVEKEGNITSDITDLELMKSMVRKEEVLGVDQRSIEREINTGVPDLAAKLVRIYTGAKFNGYVFKLSNLSKTKSYSVDIRYLTLGKPNQALLSQTDKSVLKPKEETFFRIVAKPSSVYYNVNLPFGPVQAE